jgi:hypothetical protein
LVFSAMSSSPPHKGGRLQLVAYMGLASSGQNYEVLE